MSQWLLTPADLHGFAFKVLQKFSCCYAGCHWRPRMGMFTWLGSDDAVSVNYIANDNVSIDNNLRYAYKFSKAIWVMMVVTMTMMMMKKKTRITTMMMMMVTDIHKKVIHIDRSYQAITRIMLPSRSLSSVTSFAHVCTHPHVLTSIHSHIHTCIHIHTSSHQHIAPHTNSTTTVIDSCDLVSMCRCSSEVQRRPIVCLTALNEEKNWPSYFKL